MKFIDFIKSNNTLLGLLISIIAIIAPILYTKDAGTTPDKYSLSINEIYRSSLNANEKVIGKEVFYYIGGKKYNGLLASTFQVVNTGNKAILPSDFHKPIKLSANNNLKIINIKKSFSVPKDIELKWEKINEKEFLIHPFLLNSKEWFQFVVTMDAGDSKFTEYENKSTIDWSVRIKNLSDIEIKKIDDNKLLEYFAFAQPSNLSEVIHGSGVTFELSYKSIPLIIVLTILLSLLGLLVLNKTGDIEVIRPKNTLLIILIVGFSISTSEIISYYIFGSKLASDSDKYINIPLLLLHFGILLFFVIKKILSNLKS